MKQRARWMAGVAAIVVLAGGGGLYYTRGRTGAPAQLQRARDPGFAVLLALRTLDRNPDTRLTKEQIQEILPFVKALKDVPASDADAAAAIARAVRDRFTPAQQAALEEARRQFQERQRGEAGSGGGDGGGPGGAPGGPPGAASGARGGQPGGQISDEQRNQFRARAFERMIRTLERRMKS
jgi:hypothetical protein